MADKIRVKDKVLFVQGKLKGQIIDSTRNMPGGVLQLPMDWTDEQIQKWTDDNYPLFLTVRLESGQIIREVREWELLKMD